MQINIKEQIAVLMKSAFYVNNLTPSIVNTKNRIIMSVYWVYPTNNPICLTLLPSPFTSRAIPLLFVNFSLFFWQRFFLLRCFYWLFCFQFGFVLLRFNSILVSFGYFFLVLPQFFLQVELVMSSDFSPNLFVRLFNLRTFR